jgi:transposase
LAAGERGFEFDPRKKGGDETGPNPTDRGKCGTKDHILVDQAGHPLAVLTTAANVNEGTQLPRLLDAVAPIRQRRGRPRRRPDKLHADKGYDSASNRQALRKRGIMPRIARRGVESSQKLGRYRWVVERTISWFHQFRRLRIRDERKGKFHRAFLLIAAALINRRMRFC